MSLVSRLANGVAALFNTTTSGDEQVVTLADQAGTFLGGSSTPLYTMEQGALAAATDSIALGPNSITGANPYYSRQTSALSNTTGIPIKAGAGTLYSLTLVNYLATSGTGYVSLFDAASFTAGTTVPVYEDIVALSGGATSPGILRVDFGPLGLKFGTAITLFVATTENGAAGQTYASGTPLIVNARYA